MWVHALFLPRSRRSRRHDGWCKAACQHSCGNSCILLFHAAVRTHETMWITFSDSTNNSNHICFEEQNMAPKKRSAKQLAAELTEAVARVLWGSDQTFHIRTHLMVIYFPEFLIHPMLLSIIFCFHLLRIFASFVFFCNRKTRNRERGSRRSCMSARGLEQGSVWRSLFWQIRKRRLRCVEWTWIAWQCQLKMLT